MGGEPNLTSCIIYLEVYLVIYIYIYMRACQTSPHMEHALYIIYII